MDQIDRVSACYTGHNIDELVLHLLIGGVTKFDDVYEAAWRLRYCQTEYGPEIFKKSVEYGGFTVSDGIVSL